MNYPQFDLLEFENLLKVVEQASGDPAYLAPENCPYDPKVVRAIQQMIETCQLNAPAPDADQEAKPKRGRPKKNPIQDMNEVEKELDDLRQELRQMKIDQRALPVSEQIQIFKVRASIIERMIGMKERVFNMTKTMQFITKVIGIMQDNMDQAQREAVMKELKPYAEGE